MEYPHIYFEQEISSILLLKNWMNVQKLSWSHYDFIKLN